ncbi:unnamed protein product [Sympodiomycopsis kandeliae]
MPVIDVNKLPSGEGLPDIADLPGTNVSLPVNHKAMFDFLYWCYKRHDAWRKRRAGIPRTESSDDPIISLKKSGNVVRELDDGSTFIKAIVREGKQDVEEIFFRIMFYAIWSSNANTYRHFEQELRHPPDLESFQDLARYDQILLDFRRANPKTKIYGGHSQNVPPVTLFGFTKLTALNHLRLLKVMVDIKLGQRLLDCEYLEDAAIVLKTVPTMGPYIGLCALLNLSQCDLFSWKEGGWASAGPGAVVTLRYIYGSGMPDYGTNFDLQVAGMRWIRNNQDLYWDALGIAKEDQPQCPVGASNFRWDDHGYAAPVSRGGKALRVLDIENGACHFKRYRDRRAAGRIVWPEDHKDSPHHEFYKVEEDDSSDSEADELEDLDSERHLADESALNGVNTPAVSVPIDSVAKIEETADLIGASPADSAAEPAIKTENHSEPMTGVRPLTAANLPSSSSPTPSSSHEDEEHYTSCESGASSPLTSRASTPDLRDREIYEVEKIIDKKGHLFRIRWKGWAPEWDEWRTEEDLADCPDILDEYDDYQYRVKSAIRKSQEEAKATRRARGEPGRDVTLVRPQRPKKRVADKEVKKRSPSPTIMQMSQRLKREKSSVEEVKPLIEVPSVPGGIRRLRAGEKSEDNIEVIDLCSSGSESEDKDIPMQVKSIRRGPKRKTQIQARTVRVR